MIRVSEPLPKGWTLWGNTLCHDFFGEMIPVFRNQRGVEITAMDMAQRPEFEPVFREVKRRLDIGDFAHRSPAAEVEFRVLELAKLSLQFARQALDKWEKSILETGIKG